MRMHASRLVPDFPQDTRCERAGQKRARREARTTSLRKRSHLKVHELVIEESNERALVVLDIYGHLPHWRKRRGGREKEGVFLEEEHGLQLFSTNLARADNESRGVRVVVVWRLRGRD